METRTACSSGKVDLGGRFDERPARFGLLIVLTLLAAQCAASRLLRSELDDAAITASVFARIAQDQESDASSVQVLTDEGEVYLIGRAASESALRRFEDYARRSTGVWSVINRMRLGDRRYTSADADRNLRQQISESLAAESDLKGQNIKIVVYDGEVYLIGRVAADTQRVRAVLAAQESEGVRRVYNQIKAGPRIF
ncbi:MAG: BON domain-containing protein [Leptospirales bacterium]|nr:BON domain-containing protein [Leptospirales bacterium]